VGRTSKTDARAYYDTLPALAHRCGDVWRGLPTFGTLGPESCTGIVVTPACDLSWRKSDTATYLPVIPLRAYFSLDAALPLVMEKLSAAATQLRSDLAPDWSSDAYLAPSHDDLDAACKNLDSFAAAQQLGGKDTRALSQVKSGIEIIKYIKREGTYEIPVSTLECLFGSEWGKLKERMIRNNFSPATHFIPRDMQDDIFSGVKAHSLVLFRYPLTIPLRILNLAQETGQDGWQARLDSMGLPKLLRDAFAGERPIKLLSLRSTFLSDMLTRFSALYNRVGSPDFTGETVATYKAEVDE
jgi:hypothetical protein